MRTLYDKFALKNHHANSQRVGHRGHENDIGVPLSAAEKLARVRVSVWLVIEDIRKSLIEKILFICKSSLHVRNNPCLSMPGSNTLSSRESLRALISSQLCFPLELNRKQRGGASPHYATRHFAILPMTASLVSPLPWTFT